VAKPRKAVKPKRETDIQREILQALGKETTWKEPATRKTKAGVTHYEKTVGDGLFVSESSVFFRVNSGVAKGFGGSFMKLAPKGTADIIGVVRGRAVALEVKTSVGKQSKDQKAWQRAWEARGGVYAVVRTVEQAFAIVSVLEALPFAWTESS
jgi:hypothetical protein